MDPVEATAVVPRLRFRQENEVKLNYSARITEVEWDRHADAVKHMHEQRKTRREILETLHNDHEFCPSMAQLNMYMKKRKLRVYGGGNAEPVERADDEALQAADVVVGADELPASTSLPAPQNNGTSDLQQMENLEPDSTTRDKVLVDLPADDQNREIRFPERFAQARVTTPAENVPDLSSLNLVSITPDGLDPSINLTSLTPGMVSEQSSRQSEHNVLRLLRDSGMYPAGSATMSGAVRDTENAIFQHDQRHSVSSKQYNAPGAPSIFSLMSQRSDGSSLKSFRRFAAEVARGKWLRRKDSENTLRALTIMSEDSWDFSLVTGMPSGWPLPSVPPKDTDWEAYRWNITALYMSRNVSLSTIRDFMLTIYGFKASMYKIRISFWGVGNSRTRKDWMRKVAAILRDREAAGKTEPNNIHVGNTWLAKEDYHKFLERYVESEAEFLKTARAFCDGTIDLVAESMPFLHVDPDA